MSYRKSLSSAIVAILKYSSYVVSICMSSSEKLERFALFSSSFGSFLSFGSGFVASGLALLSSCSNGPTSSSGLVSSGPSPFVFNRPSSSFGSGVVSCGTVWFTGGTVSTGLQLLFGCSSELLSFSGSSAVVSGWGATDGSVCTGSGLCGSSPPMGATCGCKFGGSWSGLALSGSGSPWSSATVPNPSGETDFGSSVCDGPIGPLSGGSLLSWDCTSSGLVCPSPIRGAITSGSLSSGGTIGSFGSSFICGNSGSFGPSPMGGGGNGSDGNCRSDNSGSFGSSASFDES